MTESVSIKKKNKLLISEDYVQLRQKGLEWIETLGSEQWTDYNLHDPGITLLENLAYAQTELGYRMGFPVTDILAKSLNEGGLDQGFFTAAEILTMKPVTLHDYRRLLTDQRLIRNAWLITRDCACEMPLFPDCAEDELVYTDTGEEEVIPRGMYNVLIELEDDPEFGNLNDGQLFTRLFFDSSKRVLDLEVRFPGWRQVQKEITLYDKFLNNPATTVAVTLYNWQNQKITTEAGFQKALRTGNIKSTWEITADGEVLTWASVPLIFFFRKNEDVPLLKLSDLKSFLEDTSGIVLLQREKLRKLINTIKDIRGVLNRHRNLAEDFCQIREVPSEDIAVCADVVLAPDADIEQVQARIYFEIEQYFNPAVRFYSLQELMERQVPVEDIFNGPFLQHGFVLEKDLEASDLRSDIYASDIINRLMDIEGVLAIQNFLMTRYDESGHALLPSQAWSLSITPQHRPRLYIHQSKLLFFKNELPFLPADRDEVMATLQQLKSLSEPFKLTVHENDLPLPVGTVRDFASYYPVQFQLPMTYGISFAGLPASVPEERKAKAKQLKAYLLFFEQLLSNGFSQLHHIPDLFILDEAQKKSYFTRLIDKHEIAMPAVDSNDNDLYFAPFGEKDLYALAESEEEGLARRNRFLDHQLARFGESFNDYVLLMNELREETGDGFGSVKFIQEKLFRDKIRFLKNYARMSTERFKAFNYQDTLKVNGMQNIPGLKSRIAHLLGLGMLRNYFKITCTRTEGQFKASVILQKETGEALLQNQTDIQVNTRHEAMVLANAWVDQVIAWVSDASRYVTKSTAAGWIYQLKDGPVIAVGPEVYTSQTLAEQAQTDLIEWAEKILNFERFFVVEHLLLRPRYYGQLTLPVCLDKDCETCSEEDPYSFRLTFVMPGWISRFSNLSFRKYAERIILTETPAHLMAKICWVGNEIYRGKDENDGILCTLLGILQNHSLVPVTDDVHKKLCECATDILGRFNIHYADAVYHNDFAALTEAEKKTLFDEEVADGILCKNGVDPAAMDEIRQALADYFAEDTCKVLPGDDDETTAQKDFCFQFNAFHQAWDQWLRESVGLDPDEALVAEKIELKLLNHQLGPLRGEYSAATIPAMKAVLNQLLSLYGTQMSLALKAELEAWVSLPDPPPVGRVKLAEIESFVKEIYCRSLTQILQAFGDKLKAYFKVWLHSGDPVPANMAWRNKVGSLMNEVRTELSNELLNDAATFALITAGLKEAYGQVRLYLFTHARLLKIFGKLKSVYPPATLHDCEDGDDGNVVKLDNTIIS